MTSLIPWIPASHVQPPIQRYTDYQEIEINPFLKSSNISKCCKRKTPFVHWPQSMPSVLTTERGLLLVPKLGKVSRSPLPFSTQAQAFKIRCRTVSLMVRTKRYLWQERNEIGREGHRRQKRKQVARKMEEREQMHKMKGGNRHTKRKKQFQSF